MKPESADELERKRKEVWPFALIVTGLFLGGICALNGEDIASVIFAFGPLVFLAVTGRL